MKKHRPLYHHHFILDPQYLYNSVARGNVRWQEFIEACRFPNKLWDLGNMLIKAVMELT